MNGYDIHQILIPLNDAAVDYRSGVLFILYIDYTNNKDKENEDLDKDDNLRGDSGDDNRS